MKPEETKEDLKKAHDLMGDFVEKGSYALTLKMFKDLNEYFCHPEEEDEC